MPPKLPHTQRLPPLFVDTYQLPKLLKVDVSTKLIDTIQRVLKVEIKYERHNNTFHFRGPQAQVKRAKALFLANINQDNPTYERLNNTGPVVVKAINSVGTFLWPEQDHSARELGEHNYQLLDGLRREFKCNIKYDDSRSCFVVEGMAGNVQAVILRIRNALRQIIARQSPGKKIYLVQNTCQQVKLINYVFPEILASNMGRRSSPGHAVQGFKPKMDTSAVSANALKIREAVLDVMPKVRWFEGIVTMRVHLGTLALKDHRLDNGACSLEDFQEMIKEENFDAQITEELGNRNHENDLLGRFQNATRFLQPTDLEVKDLFNVKPEYQASIVIDIRDNMGDLVVSKSWTADQGGNLNPSEPDFSRLNRESQRTSFLEACLSDMVTGWTWQLGISAVQVQDVGKLPTWARDLGLFYVKADAQRGRALRPFVDFEKDHEGQPLIVARKKSMKQRIVWKFKIQGFYDKYEVELAKVFNTEYTANELPGNESFTHFEERWTVDVINVDWDNILCQNRIIGIGEMAPLPLNIHAWFPTNAQDERSGHVELLHVLQLVQGIVRGTTR